MARTTGYALLAALAALVVVVSTAIFVIVGRVDVSARTGRPSLAAGGAGTAAPAAAGSWVGTWSAAPADGEPGTADGYPGWSIRNVVRTSVGGVSVRVHLSNAFGAAPLVFAHASVARSAGGGAAAVRGTMRALTFAGQESVTVPVGGGVVSDPVQLAVPERADLLVTTYAALPSGPVTFHPEARQISFMARGEHTGQVSGRSFRTPSPYWRYVSAVDVLNARAAGSVVFLGDSITDGFASSVGANHRWPDYLADRLSDAADPRLRLGVLNEGISGNRVLRDGFAGSGQGALRRLERDALSQTGVRTMVVELGINDIIRPPQQGSADAVVAGLREIVARGHARGIRVIGGTLLPFEGHGMYGPATEAVRERVNAAIRAGTVYDAVIDFDKALRDPYRPTRMLPGYDSGDHLHPGDAGYRRMAEAVRPALLRGSAATKV
ncbi:SGNH/GDSL hydrolase family protein [Streptomyces sp. NPDC088732]|uniref:SGNH/GDSL hydrolase family protein n=1 Tax=Streptomyces sp. NPDC088732 TaxID=3365879 RepID=UPI00382F149B